MESSYIVGCGTEQKERSGDKNRLDPISWNSVDAPKKKLTSKSIWIVSGIWIEDKKNYDYYKSKKGTPSKMSDIIDKLQNDKFLQS